MKYNSQLDYLHMMCDYMQMGADAGLDNKGCLMARGKRERCLGQVTKLSASSWKFIICTSLANLNMQVIEKCNVLLVSNILVSWVKNIENNFIYK